MTKQKSKPIIEAFFERLVAQQASTISAQDLYRRQVQIFCGRWLALRRLSVGRPLDQLAAATGLSQQTIVFAETGLAEIEMATDTEWRHYSQQLALSQPDALWVWMVLMLALGRARVPSERVMMRVMTDLQSVYGAKAAPASGAPEPLSSGEQSAVTSPQPLILRWLAKSVRSIHDQLGGPLTLSVQDLSAAIMLTFGPIAYRDISDAAFLGSELRVDRATAHASATELSLITLYLSTDALKPIVNVGPSSRQPSTSLAQHARPRVAPLGWVWDEASIRAYAALIPHALAHTAPPWLPGWKSDSPVLADIYVSLTTDGKPRLVRRLARPSTMPVANQDAEGTPTPRHSARQRGALRQSDPALITIAVAETADQAVAEASRLLLLGPPGSGKTTTLHAHMLTLARALAVPDAPASPEARPPRAPIYCALDSLAGRLRLRGRLSGARLLREILAVQPASPNVPHDRIAQSLREALVRGQALLLLDGLADVPAWHGTSGHSLRAQFAAAIRKLGRILPAQTQIVIAYDSPGYDQASAPDLDGSLFPASEGWEIRTLQPLAEEQQRAIAKRWFHMNAPHSEPPLEPWGERHSSAFISRLAADRELRALCASPLALTLVLNHLTSSDSPDLPHTHTQLYDRYVDDTLKHLPESQLAIFATPLHIVRSADDIWAALVIRRSAVQAAAFEWSSQREATSRPAGQRDGPDKVPSVPSSDQIQSLRQLFPHPALQDFLAACHLAAAPKLAQRAYGLWQEIGGDRTRALLLLMASRLGQLGSAHEKLIPWLAALLGPTDPLEQPKSPRQLQRDALLAADSYAECGRRDGLSGASPAMLAALEQAIAAVLLYVLEPEPLSPTAERLRAAAHLAVLEDPRPGVTSGAPTLCALAADRPGGADSATDIARYLTTNAQWRLFMQDGGYGTAEWWGSGWEHRSTYRWAQPLFWDVASYNESNQPVVGISWYEARAFCAWLTWHGRAAGWLRADQCARLPHVDEWRLAAYGADGRAFPWGNRWQAESANTYELGLGRPTPVGCFPQAASPAGALDMCGNVAEWCQSRSPEQRCYRCGGSWAEAADQAKRDAERITGPLARGNLLGFRIVVAPSSH